MNLMYSIQGPPELTTKLTPLSLYLPHWVNNKKRHDFMDPINIQSNEGCKSEELQDSEEVLGILVFIDSEIHLGQGCW